MYTLTNVTKTYRTSRTVTALDNVSLEIPDGQFLAVRGNTGGGKSTLLQMLGGLDRPTSGTVAVDGKDITTASESALTRFRATDVGIVFQGFNLVSTLTAAQNVEAGLVPLGVKAGERRERAIDALKDVGLSGREDHLPSELSGGQQQRVAIARALVKQPRIILADEPTGNLDEAMRDEVMALLEKEWKRLGFTLVMVTHDSSVAGRAERQIRITSGHLA
ncbi:MAG: ABC transporter ATP-binding protein [Actinomyces sp.]|jgi:putative ABC transport system ATP-binding protein|nr:ABC transporter ATP-binding protein [Actinomyces sp.]MCI1641617.1 ABC transporter ATP-binding protein [Actinomyces sp.]MCI1661645.1 ABC transporter ATP-binding protein [Actinomyces sp.]MCI1691310.1 ABC transporter ATP-binding protein [Actinomyces sp.]MCI1787586.1 ABC transporter ATP-binding protein [Actinomyces sp.]MCI1830206.1 ABC transporter ATP-binding protein [Actinomyces sp.]